MKFSEYYKDIVGQKEAFFNPMPYLLGYRDALLDVNYIEGISCSIIEVARNSTILRCCATNGHLTNEATTGKPAITDEFALESVGAHANLVGAIADSALDFINQNRIAYCRYTYREIMAAIRYHDLTENITGDTSDNGERDEEKKRKTEEAYFDKFFKNWPERDHAFVQNVRAILREMDEKETEIGKVIYLADKVAAIIMTLCYDDFGVYPVAFEDDQNLSRKCREDMRICDQIIDVDIVDENGEVIGSKHGYLLSELWTIDFFRDRELYTYDFSGFFTAILVMITLIIRDDWYTWREDDY